MLLTFLRSSCSPALVDPPLFRSSSHRRPSRCRPPHRCSCCRSHPHRFTWGLSSHRSSFVVALARRRLCPTAHRCPVAPLRRSTRWHCHTSHLPSQPPAEDALRPRLAAHHCLQLRERCTVERHLRLPTSAQARVSPRLSASPPRLHHWQRQNRNRLEACNLCNVRNFEGWELVTCVIRHLLDIHRGSLPAAKHLLGIHPVEACRRQSTCLGCRG